MSKRRKYYPAEYDHMYGYDHMEYHEYHSMNENMRQEVTDPFIKQLETYDASYSRLSNHGGNISNLLEIQEILNTPITLKKNWFIENNPILSDIKSVKNVLSYLHDIKFDVRKLKTGFPAYLMVRVADSFDDYLILEIMYKSPGYVIYDDRYIRLMSYSNEYNFLNLHHFRVEIARHYHYAMKEGKKDIDKILREVGRLIFQPMWIEYQDPKHKLLKFLELKMTLQVLELLYLILGSYLTVLRSKVSDDMLRFFECIYPQPLVRKFLQDLPDFGGSLIDELPKKMLRFYNELNKGVDMLLQSEVDNWGFRSKEIKLYKIFFSNYFRLEMLDELKSHVKIKKARTELETFTNRLYEGMQQYLG